MPDCGGLGIYERMAVYGAVDGFIRPGGLELTKRALSLCVFSPGSRLLDVGCGTGATVEYLVGRHGFAATGVDRSWSMLEMGSARNPLLPLIRAAIENLPFCDGEWDGILAECSLSLTADTGAALRECRRVLKRGGKLILSDVYMNDPQAIPDLGSLHTDCFTSCAFSKNQLMEEIKGCGFKLLAWEDHSEALKHFAARLILANTAAESSRCSPMGPWDRFRAGLGYFLAIAEDSTG